MRREKENQRIRTGFTLVEMLTTLAVIGVLLALLIPALSMVGKKAKMVKQEAQFYSIGVGLEAFRSDWGDYPPSEYSPLFGDLTGNAPYTCASQRLAEALVGRDGLGFHRDSEFRARGMADVDGDGTLDPIAPSPSPPGIYNAVDGFTGSGGTVQSAADNLAARQGPYLEVETANAVQILDIYNSVGVLDETYVLADVFEKKMTATDKQVGMPILYYRAHTNRIGNDPALPVTAWGNNTYNLNDSFCNLDGFICMGVPFQSDYTQHPLGNCGNSVTDANRFYGMIANPNFTSPPRPYRANSFLLQSAGPDGVYGTPDDMFNF